jgi:UDP-N-acetylglucosamine 2-epimerase (non-hydrolysing)
MKKIISIVGARPNFMKISPIQRVLAQKKNEFTHRICHTGQHYDDKMSDVFFSELEIPKPDFYLGIGAGSHAAQTAKIMVEFERVCLEEHPDLVLVVGDVNSTIACGITAKKLGIKLAHVEAGLRSFDMQMPEEINRILTDVISDFLFVTEESGVTNLRNEGKDSSRVHFVGNVMIDTLIALLPKIEKSDVLTRLSLDAGKFIVSTFHRPSNVDDELNLSGLITFLNFLSQKHPVVFPIHPRTKSNLEKFNLLSRLSSNVIFTSPLGYLDFIKLMKNSALIATDSGGIQEESTYLGVQCMTLRDNTERPSTVEIGTNHLVGTHFLQAQEAAEKIFSGELKTGKVPPLWDGKAAERIIKVLADQLSTI